MELRHVPDELFRQRFADEQNFGREHAGKKSQRRAGIRRADSFFQFPAADFFVRLFRRALDANGRSRAADYLFCLCFLGAVAVWQLLSLIVGVSHKNKLGGRRKSDTSTNSETMKTAELNETPQNRLHSADLENIVAPPSVTENTTKHLDKIPRK